MDNLRNEKPAWKAEPSFPLWPLSSNLFVQVVIELAKSLENRIIRMP